MVRTLVRTGIMFCVYAVALIFASIFVGGVGINVIGFLIALLIFTVCVGVLTPLFTSRLPRRDALAVGGVALGATLVSLIITDLVSDGLDITGVGAWLWATVILWGSALLATLLLPYFGLRRFFEKRDDRR